MKHSRNWLRKLVPTLVGVSIWGATIPRASAATVTDVDGKHVVLELDEGEKFEKGDQLEIKGKKKTKALLKVKTLRSGRVMADVIKGKANEGDVAKKSDDEEEEDDEEYSSFGRPRKYWHVTGGLSMDSHTVTITNSANVPMTGMSYFMRVSRSTPIKKIKSLFWEAGGAYEMMHTTGSISTGVCKGSKDCMLDINAITPFAKVGFIALTLETVQFQLKAGVDALIPMSASSNVVDIKANSPFLFVTLGICTFFGLEDNQAIPVTIEMSQNPSAGASKFSRMLFSTGYSFP